MCSVKLDLFSAILDHACMPIMVIRSHRAICLSSHTKGTPSARIIRTRRRLLYSRRSHTVHTLPASLMLVCFAANPKRISEWRISTAERKVQPLQYVRTFNSPCSCSSRKYSSATPITQIMLSHDLGTELSYLLLPSCRHLCEKPWTDRCSSGSTWVAEFHIIACFTTNTKTRVKSC